MVKNWRLFLESIGRKWRTQIPKTFWKSSLQENGMNPNRPLSSDVRDSRPMSGMLSFILFHALDRIKPYATLVDRREKPQAEQWSRHALQGSRSAGYRPVVRRPFLLRANFRVYGQNTTGTAHFSPKILLPRTTTFARNFLPLKSGTLSFQNRNAQRQCTRCCSTLTPSKSASLSRSWHRCSPNSRHSHRHHL